MSNKEMIRDRIRELESLRLKVFHEHSVVVMTYPILVSIFLYLLTNSISYGIIVFGIIILIQLPFSHFFPPGKKLTKEIERNYNLLLGRK